MKLNSLPVILLAFLIFMHIHLYAQEVRGLRIYVDLAASTYLKFQKPIDAIDGTYLEKGYNYKNRSGGNALTITLPRDKALERAQIEISEGGRNHVFVITPYPEKYDPNTGLTFDYIMDHPDKLKKFKALADQQNNASGVSPVVNPPAVDNPGANPPNPGIVSPPPKSTADDGYAAKIKAADKAFNERRYYQAKVAYMEAYQVRMNEKYPLDRIQLINKIVEQQEDSVRIIDASYASELQKADRYFMNYEYVLAKAYYTKAGSIKSQESYPKNRIAEIDKILQDLKDKEKAAELAQAQAVAQLAAEQGINSKYKSAIDKGDKAFEDRQYTAAITAYTEAKKIKPGEKYPDDKLLEIAGIKSAKETADAEALIKLNEQALTSKYDGLISKGDKALRDKQYAAAKTAYTEALALKPGSNIATEKLEAVESEITKTAAAAAERQQQAIQKELDTKYLAAITKADKAFKAKNYETAKTEYYNAQTLKPGEAYAQSQLTIIENKLAEIAAATAQEKEIAGKYQRYVTIADKAYLDKNYEMAKTSYNLALEVKANDVYAKGKIAAIEKIEQELEIKQAQAALQELNDRYDSAIAQADKLYNSNDLVLAKAAYEKALDLIPNKSYPANQVKLIQRKEYEQAELEKTEKYNGFIALGDKAFNAKSYESARDYYKKALEVRPDETYPQKQIDITNDPSEIQRIAKREELKNYNQYVNDGDRAFSAGKYNEAKELYLKAKIIQADVPYLNYKLNQIDELMAVQNASDKAKVETAAQKEKDDKFNALVANAEKAYKDNDFAKAKKYYNQALEIKPGDPVATDKISVINKQVAQAEQEAIALNNARKKESEINDQVNKLVKKADKEFADKQYADAKRDYESAVLLKPDDTNIKDKLAKVEKLLSAEIAVAENAEKSNINLDEVNSNYSAAINRANKAFDAKLYYEAKAAYTDALSIKPNESLPASKLKEIDDALAQENANAQTPAKTVATTTGKPSNVKAGNKTVVQAVALPYNQADLYRRYNTINFYDPPPGQKLIVDAYFASDTLSNYNLSQQFMAEPGRVSISDSANNVKLTLVGINFEGSSAFIKLRIQNFGKREFLTGRMLFTWYRKTEPKVDYYAGYITAYPYLLPGKEITITYVTRTANPSEGETFTFLMEDRLKTTRLELLIPSETYIKEYDRE